MIYNCIHSRSNQSVFNQNTKLIGVEKLALIADIALVVILGAATLLTLLAHKDLPFGPLKVMPKPNLYVVLVLASATSALIATNLLLVGKRHPIPKPSIQHANSPLNSDNQTTAQQTEKINHLNNELEKSKKEIEELQKRLQQATTVVTDPLNNSLSQPNQIEFVKKVLTNHFEDILMDDSVEEELNLENDNKVDQIEQDINQEIGQISDLFKSIKANQSQNK